MLEPLFLPQSESLVNLIHRAKSEGSEDEKAGALLAQSCMPCAKPLQHCATTLDHAQATALWDVKRRVGRRAPNTTRDRAWG